MGQRAESAFTGRPEFTGRLEFIDRAADFLTVAQASLAAEPVLGSVVATVAEREVRATEAGRLPAGDGGRPHWYVVARDEAGEVAGLGMRTASFLPYPLFLLPMPEPAARELGRVLVERGEQVGGVNGALPAARVCAEEIAARSGSGVEVEVAQHTRLFELGELVAPAPAPAQAPVPGRPRVAEPDDVDLVHGWFAAFLHDADLQAGRVAGTGSHESLSRDEVAVRIAEGRLHLWLDERGVPVHMTGCTVPAMGVSRVGPVYTPGDHRGRGYAGACVAHVSARILADGDRACLFTDQANPTSNAIYQRLGYRPVVDMANLILR